MADQKKWFKVWTSILSDDKFDLNRKESLEDIGRWTILGAYTALHGTAGKVKINREYLLKIMKINSLEALQKRATLRNVTLKKARNGYDEINVTFKKWYSYQVDTTSAERMQTLRRKKREEEIRKEEIRENTVTPLGNFPIKKFPEAYDPEKKLKKIIVNENNDHKFLCYLEKLGVEHWKLDKETKRRKYIQWQKTNTEN